MIRFMVPLLSASCIATLCASVPGSAHGQGAVHPGFTPTHFAPLITGQASAPITVSVQRQKDENSPQPPADRFTFTVTAKDMDTWTNNLSGATIEFADVVHCVKMSEGYATASDPTLRGVDTNYVTTWDFVLYGLSVDWNAKPIVPKVFVNVYKIYDNAGTQGRNTSLDDPEFSYIMAQQTINRPAG